MTISQAISKLNEIMSAHGDLAVDTQVEFHTGDISQIAQGTVENISVLHKEGVFKRVVITSIDES